MPKRSASTEVSLSTQVLLSARICGVRISDVVVRVGEPVGSV